MAKRTVLPFERPIHDLEQKIEQQRRFGTRNGVDVEHAVRQLEERLAQTRVEVYQSLSPYQRVQLARHPDRPHALDYVERCCEDFLELHGDRRFADDRALLGGFAKLEGRRVMLICQQKGRDVKDNVQRNFGMPHPEGYRKALRLMRLAEKARTPVVCLIDTPGAFPGIGSEERHVGEAIAVNLREMFTLRVPVVCAVIGEGGSGGALGIAVGDRVLIMEYAYYSVITPEGCAAILWKSSLEEQTAAAAAALKLTAPDLEELGIVDDIVPEPEGGAHLDWDAAAANLRTALARELAGLAGTAPTDLLENRYQRFRCIGRFVEP